MTKQSFKWVLLSTERKEGKNKNKAKWEEKQRVEKSLGIVCRSLPFIPLGIQREKPEGVSRKFIFEKNLFAKCYTTQYSYFQLATSRAIVYCFSHGHAEISLVYTKWNLRISDISSLFMKGIKNQKCNSYNICTSSTKML